MKYWHTVCHVHLKHELIYEQQISFHNNCTRGFLIFERGFLFEHVHIMKGSRQLTTSKHRMLQH